MPMLPPIPVSKRRLMRVVPLLDNGSMYPISSEIFVACLYMFARSVQVLRFHSAQAGKSFLEQSDGPFDVFFRNGKRGRETNGFSARSTLFHPQSFFKQGIGHPFSFIDGIDTHQKPLPPDAGYDLGDFFLQSFKEGSRICSFPRGLFGEF